MTDIRHGAASGSARAAASAAQAARTRTLAGLALSLAAAALCATAMASCARAKETAAKAPRAVRVLTVEKRDFALSSEIAARIAPSLQVSVTPKVGGRVASVRAEVGERVLEGTVLLELEATDYDAQYRQAKASLGSARASLARTSDSAQEQQTLQAQAAADQAAVAYDETASLYEKTKRLYDSGAVSEQQLDDVEARYKSAGIQLDAARKALAIVKDKAGSQSSEIAAGQVDAASAQAELAKSQLEAATIRSPIAGRVSYRGVEAGEMIGTSTLAFVVIDDSSVVAEAGLSERQVGRVRPGMAIEVYVPALRAAQGATQGGTTFPGKVDSVSPAADPRSMLYALKVRVPNPKGLIKGGMIARLRIPLESRRGAVVAPERAVFSENGGDFAFVASPDGAGGRKAEKRRLRLGETDGESVEILEGLSQGDLVVVEGKEFIGSGDPVDAQGSVAP
jgi:RND family efflux transporter MFP subunit